MLSRSARARFVIALLTAVGVAAGPRAALCIGDAGHVEIEAVDAECCDAPHLAAPERRCAPHDGEDSDCTDRALKIVAVAPSATQDGAVALGHLPTGLDAVAALPAVHLDTIALGIAAVSPAARLPVTPRRQHTTVQRC